MYAPIGVSQGHGGSRVYNLSQCKTLPEFMAEALRENRSLKKNKEFKERLEVIQGFEFSTSCAKVVVSKDSRFIGAIGMYPPDLKVYDTQDLSMKFLRRFDCEPIDLLFLTEDYRKLVTLQNDRFLEFHNQSGRHHRMRLPTHGRQLNYDKMNAELIITAADVYRLDLSEGKFKEPLRTQHREPTVAAVADSRLFLGGSQPEVELYDTRASLSPVDRICATADGATATAIASDQRNSLAVGDSSGVVTVHDLRQPHGSAVCEKRHQIDEPIKDVHFVTIRNDIDADWAIASADSWQVKVWRPTSGTIQNYATFEGQGKINSLCPCPNSGLIFVAQDHCRVGVHFLPAMGLAPSWSPFIDQIIDDFDRLNESAGLGDHKFITHADLSKLGLRVTDDRLVPYQHGFLIPNAEYDSILKSSEILTSVQLLKTQISQQIAQVKADSPFAIDNIRIGRSDARPPTCKLGASDNKCSNIADTRFTHLL